MILCVGATPALQRVMTFQKVTVDTVNRAVSTLDGVAGKSVNVAKVLRAVNEPVVATGFLGGARGEVVLACLEAKGAHVDFVPVPVPTRQCITLIDQSSQTQTELVEESYPVSPSAYDALLHIVERRIGACRAVVLSGTITPGGPVSFYHTCTLLAHHHRVLSIVDAQGPLLNETLKARPELVKPNQSELAATLGRQLANEHDVMAAMRHLHELGAARIVVTAGKSPALAYDGQIFWRIFPPTIEVLNPIGSGDAFTAGLAWRLIRGDDLGEACRWGCALGASNAMTFMAGELDPATAETLAKEVKVERV
jgi:tagatose 6-phosphate kinase